MLIHIWHCGSKYLDGAPVIESSGVEVALTVIWQSESTQLPITGAVEALEDKIIWCNLEQNLCIRWWPNWSVVRWWWCWWSSSLNLVSCVDNHPPCLLSPSNPVPTNHHLGNFRLSTIWFKSANMSGRLNSLSLTYLHQSIQTTLGIVDVPRDRRCPNLRIHTILWQSFLTFWTHILFWFLSSYNIVTIISNPLNSYPLLVSILPSLQILSHSVSGTSGVGNWNKR